MGKPGFGQEAEKVVSCAEDLLKLEFSVSSSVEKSEDRSELISQIRGKLITGFKGQGLKGNWSAIKKNAKISSFKVQGYVGPESMEGGPRSILEKNIDPKNVSRAEERARLVLNLVKQQLNISPETQLPESVIGQELQFNPGEWNRLNFYATGKDVKAGFKTGWIFNIIRMYLKGETLNAEATKGLKEIYGRRDIIYLEICYQADSAKESDILSSVPLKGKIEPEKGVQIDDKDEASVVTKTVIWIVLILIFLAIATRILLKWYREYLEKKPAFEKDFSDSDRMVRPSIRMSKNSIIAILGGKGGSGKSSISSSLAYLLAHCGFRTLIVDTDLFTHGISLLTVPKAQQQKLDTISSLLIEKGHKTAEDMEPTLIETPFTRDNLYILPSFPSEELQLDNLNLKSSAQTVKGFSKKLRECLIAIKHKYRFDFILIDTRGGTDLTNIGAAVAAESFVLVTEPGKVSWDLGEQLLDGIHKVKKELLLKTTCMGFIINKNMLGVTEIEEYLQKKWDLNHIATVPFDDKAVECFEQGKVAVAENMRSDFSKGILEIMEKATYSSGWNNYNNAYLKKIKKGSIFSAFLKALEKKGNKSES